MPTKTPLVRTATSARFSLPVAPPPQIRRAMSSRTVLPNQSTRGENPHQVAINAALKMKPMGVLGCAWYYPKCAVARIIKVVHSIFSYYFAIGADERELLCELKKRLKVFDSSTPLEIKSVLGEYDAADLEDLFKNHIAAVRHKLGTYKTIYVMETLQRARGGVFKEIYSEQTAHLLSLFYCISSEMQFPIQTNQMSEFLKKYTRKLLELGFQFDKKLLFSIAHDVFENIRDLKDISQSADAGYPTGTLPALTSSMFDELLLRFSKAKLEPFTAHIIQHEAVPDLKAQPKNEQRFWIPFMLQVINDQSRISMMATTIHNKVDIIRDNDPETVQTAIRALFVDAKRKLSQAVAPATHEILRHMASALVKHTNDIPKKIEFLRELCVKELIKMAVKSVRAEMKAAKTTESTTYASKLLKYTSLLSGLEKVIKNAEKQNPLTRVKALSIPTISNEV